MQGVQGTQGNRADSERHAGSGNQLPARHVHFDKRTYALKKNAVSLYTLGGRVIVPMRLGEHQRRILSFGRPKEAELVFRKGNWYFNLVVESDDKEPIASGPVMGVDVGENNLAAHSLGGIFGGGRLCDRRDRHLALRRRLQSNGSRSAKQKLRQVSGKERRHVTHVNHETSKAIVREALEAGVAKIMMEDLTHIRDRIQGWQAHARKIASLGLPAAPTLCRVQGEIGRHRGRIRRSGLHEPNLLVL
ncbi:transposase [Verrucomicrobium sp. 3C]|uniref:transposase n=1 Tax=Verrucomicrobium sp. 3C TaxID=1134055 RepID=UPI001E609F0D|nr:transposase [Verrucomicrobium sp. 3C]